MMLKVTKTEVWAAEIDDRPGGLALTLKAISDFGADLDCVIARRQPDKKGKGVVFIEPLTGKEQLDNADQAGFHATKKLATLKIEGPNKPGIGAEITKAIGDDQVSMYGLSAVAMGRKFVCYASFDTAGDADRAMDALKRLNKRKLHWPVSKKTDKKAEVAAGV